MTRIAILGATGYTALELITILLRHPQAEITTLTTRQEDRPRAAAVHPSLEGRLDLVLENLSPQEVAGRADCVFSCLPHAASAAVIPAYLDAGCKVVDFSADYRLDNPAVFAAWYGVEHPDPDRLPTTVYGLPELFREHILGADLVANPGCYPTSAILALAPLLKAGLIAPKTVIIDSKSGVSGAGRTPKPTTHFPECNESFSAYNLGKHRHTPEIELILTKTSDAPVEVIFSPHLVPMNRGILTTAYAQPKESVTEAEVMAVLREFYADEPFVQVIDDLPATKNVSGTNFCHLSARVVRDTIVTVSCIDNLVKGASGAAVQNFNLMYGYAETTALF